MVKITPNKIYYYTCFILFPILVICNVLFSDFSVHLRLPGWIEVSATSINYGISQQPITDISQLMPKLCQNQSVICEGSYCIPGVKKCVCDLRMPVQIGRFCLRQVDIDTKCFASSQCNHTVKDAVCIDVNSRAMLDADSSKFKLDQWHQLNELKKSSQSTLAKDPPTSQQFQMHNNRELIGSRSKAFLLDGKHHVLRASAQNNVIPANTRNSPYEISYDTPELLHQNHTRRRTNNSDRVELDSFLNTTTTQGRSDLSQTDNPPAGYLATSTALPQTSTQSDESSSPSLTFSPVTQTTNGKDGAHITSAPSDMSGRKKITFTNTNWPPGVCSCPNGFMFDAMLRKCLALSLADSHCVVDTDCKQIASSHCSQSSRKCECDEPFVWDQQQLTCTRPKQPVRTEGTTAVGGDEKREQAGFMDNLLPPLVLAKLMPDYTLLLAIFVVLVIIGTLLLLKLTVKCFSSNSSALISPKGKKKKLDQNSMPTRSPYTTLRRPDQKPGSQLSNFTQVTRGRILNYDFEQDSPRGEPGQSSPSLAIQASATLRPSKADRSSSNNYSTKQYSATLKSAPRGHKYHSKDDRAATSRSTLKSVKKEESIDDTPLELNDNISIGHLESESKSESSNIVVPGPPPTQQPPYMLKNPMRGQSSAIAAAAAAVANKRLQKMNLDQQQSNGRVFNESPVFL